MSTWAVLATGQSLNQGDVDLLRGKCSVVAVSDAYKLAPWADVLVSVDAAWWRNHPEAMGFSGDKYTASPDWQGLTELKRLPGVASGTNSGLFGLMVATHLGAKRILMLGFDMRGTHFFGEHPAPLKNPTTARFEVFKKQFSLFKPRGVEIVNCTNGSGLTAYRMGNLACELG